MPPCQGKESWPELVGVNGEVAARIIEKQNHFVKAVIIPEGSIITNDYRCDRVWVAVDKNGVVFRVPTIG